MGITDKARRGTASRVVPILEDQARAANHATDYTIPLSLSL